MGRKLIGAALAAVVVLGAGCGDDDGATPVDAVTTTAAQEPDDGGGGTADAVVDVVGFEFQPATLEVAAGAAVTWTNGDGVPHTVTAGTPEAVVDTFHESLDPGGTATVTFDEAGTFVYHCAVHPGMRGEVVVS